MATLMEPVNPAADFAWCYTCACGAQVSFTSKDLFFMTTKEEGYTVFWAKVQCPLCRTESIAFMRDACGLMTGHVPESLWSAVLTLGGEKRWRDYADPYKERKARRS